MTARTSPPPTPGIAWESLKQASARTGFTEATLRDKINDGSLPAYRISSKPGAAIRVKVEDVDALFTPYLAESVSGGAA